MQNLQEVSEIFGRLKEDAKNERRIYEEAYTGNDREHYKKGTRICVSILIASQQQKRIKEISPDV